MLREIDSVTMISGFKRRLDALVGKEVATQLLMSTAVVFTFMVVTETARIPRPVLMEAD